MPTNLRTRIVALDAAAVKASALLAERISAADLARPTPCADWTLHGLLRHMIAQHYGFAAAAAGDGDPARWRLRPLGDDPAAAYRSAADHVLSAFSDSDLLTREFPLPEITRQPSFPAEQAVSFHFVDYVVHSWDLAKTLGRPVHFDAALLDAALGVALAVPGGEARRVPGAAFAPAVLCEGGSPLDRIVAVLGRSPGWHPPVSR